MQNLPLKNSDFKANSFQKSSKAAELFGGMKSLSRGQKQHVYDVLKENVGKNSRIAVENTLKQLRTDTNDGISRGMTARIKDSLANNGSTQAQRKRTDLSAIIKAGRERNSVVAPSVNRPAPVRPVLKSNVTSLNGVMQMRPQLGGSRFGLIK